MDKPIASNKQMPVIVNKGVHVYQLTVCFLSLENHTSWMFP